jgi:hypothetical protein
VRFNFSVQRQIISSQLHVANMAGPELLQRYPLLMYPAVTVVGHSSNSSDISDPRCISACQDGKLK